MKRLISAGLGSVAIAAVVAATPVVMMPGVHARSTVTHEVTLTSVAVPPGGLIASVIGNQFRYCAIICPLVVDAALTAAVTGVRAPGTFLAALRSADLFRALGIAAASVTGPTNAAAQAAILADGSQVAPRALNAFQNAVVGLLDVIPALADGVPGVLGALQKFREDTYTALNRPIVPDPEPTVDPQGVLQVAVVESINIGAAVIFPAFNHVLSSVFDVPDAFAQELATSGDPIRAVVAGVRSLAEHLIAAGTVIAEAVVTAVTNIGAAIEDSREAPEPETAEVSALAPRSTVGGGGGVVATVSTDAEGRDNDRAAPDPADAPEPDRGDDDGQDVPDEVDEPPVDDVDTPESDEDVTHDPDEDVTEEEPADEGDNADEQDKASGDDEASGAERADAGEGRDAAPSEGSSAAGE
ncbi:hypothetical protein [Mycolicibacterium sp.]|uniref:hypothetical protein n=1 Tax=Mycolicibacterium sp. TaxID=2320850 RepID=UPI003D0C68B7